MNRIPLPSSAALITTAALSAAAAVLRRLLRHRAVDQAVRTTRKEAATGTLPTVAARDAAAGTGPARKESLPVTQVPDNTVAATAAPAEAVPEAGGMPQPEEPDGRPTRTWVVDNGPAWDGNPLELVVRPS